MLINFSFSLSINNFLTFHLCRVYDFIIDEEFLNKGYAIIRQCQQLFLVR